MANDQYTNPIRSASGFPQRDRYKSGQTPVVRIALEEEVSKKIAIIRWMKDQEGDSLNSLSSVVEDAVLHYFDFYMTDRELPTRDQYAKFLKTSKRN